MAAKQAEQTKPELLIVDDDPLITDTLNFVLSRDFTVYVADSRDRKSTRLNSSHIQKSRMPSSA